MKRLSLLSLLSFFLLLSCNKNDSGTPDPAGPGAPIGTNNGLPTELRTILADSLVVNLESRGLKINRGNTPPNIEGIYLTSPLRVTSNFGPSDPYKVGKIVNDYLFNFFNQQGTKANMSYRNRYGDDTTTGLGTLISGADNKFTLYAENAGVSGGVKHKLVCIVSGEVTPTAMKNLQLCFILTSKEEDILGQLLQPGQARIYDDSDGTSEKQTSYSF